MYVVLTTKPGEYRSEGGEGVETIAAYEYRFYGKTKAIFTIAKINEDSRVLIIEEGPGGTTNNITTRQMEKFDTVDDAYAELESLTNFGSIDAELIKAE
ncbi:ferredoxin [Paenalcaligenes niemegkensis]|uniref:ferredoxin n=1 Tax=Paenalcaligenes niemegkensis TaxID=2895469 RepID=UPI001EE9402C|nr:ferredoxin [Paenalcaligenes niemegkensis]MCQ9617744.1 ferredoxin [Paenalcaligenes niemegkensis]